MPRARRLPSEPAAPPAPQPPPEPVVTGSGAAAEGNLERAIGEQVRALRQRAGLTVTELAHAASLSGGMMSKIENGQISPSLATLQSLARALNVGIGQLFASFGEQRDCSFVRAGDGVVIERRGTRAGHRYNLLGHGLGGPVVMEPYLITFADGAEPYTGFRHDGVELIYILTGAVAYRHGEQVYAMQPGDSLMFDSAAPHGPERIIARPLAYLSVIVYPRQGERVS